MTEPLEDENPVITALFLSGVSGGCLFGWTYYFGGWTLGQSLMAGIIGGLVAGFTMLPAILVIMVTLALTTIFALGWLWMVLG